LELNNTLLRNDIIAANYPIEKRSCYVSDDDGGALLTFVGHEIAETICVERGATTLLQLKSSNPNCSISKNPNLPIDFSLICQFNSLTISHNM